MSKLRDALESGKFVITSELNPPKGVNLESLFEKVDLLKDRVDGINLTDSHAARMSMAPMAAAHLLLDRGAEPIVQMTSRDRNRIALQADMLGAAALGIHNMVFMGGDPPTNGDHPDAKPVFDVYTSMLLEAANALTSGTDMNGNVLSGTPDLFIGAVVNPGASDLDGEIGRMEEKIEAGARFFQTQAIYDAGAFETFAKAVERFDVPVLAGIIPIKSRKMAQYMNTNVPGIDIPESLIEEVATAKDRASTSVDISARIIRAIRPACQGVHIMAIGWEDKIPAILEQAEIS